MPVVGTTAYNTAGQITALVRSLLNDAAGNLFTDAVLLPYVNSGYRKAQRALANIQSGSFLTDNVLLVVPAVRKWTPRCRCRSPTRPRRPISCRPTCWCR